MWIFVTMDFSRTGKGRMAQNDFCRLLAQDGFSLLNRNTWVRYCTTGANARTHKKKIKELIPDNCCVTIILASDTHDEHFYNHYGRHLRQKKYPNLPDKPSMIEFF